MSSLPLGLAVNPESSAQQKASFRFPVAGVHLSRMPGKSIMANCGDDREEIEKDFHMLAERVYKISADAEAQAIKEVEKEFHLLVEKIHKISSDGKAQAINELRVFCEKYGLPIQEFPLPTVQQISQWYKEFLNRQPPEELKHWERLDRDFAQAIENIKKLREKWCA